jgi:hypothetical protein
MNATAKVKLDWSTVAESSLCAGVVAGDGTRSVRPTLEILLLALGLLGMQRRAGCPCRERCRPMVSTPLNAG